MRIITKKLPFDIAIDNEGALERASFSNNDA